MKKISLFALSVSFLVLSGCSPRVASNITKSYAALPAESPIEVFNTKSNLPVKSEVLGNVSVKDSGMSTKCDSATVINKIKDEARKVGGNAVVIEKHTKPSIWGSSCHQMEALVLNVSDFTTLATADNPAVVYVEKNKAKLLPRFTLVGNFGYGWRTNKLDPKLTGDEKDYAKKLMNGPIWDFSANYYFNDTYGLGLVYSAYSSSTNAWGTMTETNQAAKLETKDMITFVGPAFLGRGASSNLKWIFNVQLGIGYIGYTSKATLLNEYEKNSGASVGLSSKIGAEYKFSDNWGIGADLAAVSGVLSSITKDQNGHKTKVNFPKNSKEGLNHLRLSLGLRYYFK